MSTSSVVVVVIIINVIIVIVVSAADAVDDRSTTPLHSTFLRSAIFPMRKNALPPSLPSLPPRLCSALTRTTTIMIDH